MLKRVKFLLTFLVLSLFLSGAAFGGQNVRVGLGLPNGMYGEYEYKMLLDMVGFYGNIGTLDGSVSTLGGDSTDVSLSSWSIGARYYVPLMGVNFKAGFTGITAEGDISGVEAKAELVGLDLGVGYEIGLGPVFGGVEVGMILGKPDITPDVSLLSGAFKDVFDQESFTYGKIFVGWRF